ncbi:helix-turn-helix transcriptional regulator [Glutamicibacter halophytocola]|uniref:helix-turn-helix transcriptional regulator n=1 Tax=Glutamicibacter halophytocola TaxID=1933880 RepID=UPI0015C53958|nr:excisionase [Glutamicibacter halophytocola]NQD40563.1 excisionase [Glutamicibacter halophytocola]
MSNPQLWTPEQFGAFAQLSADQVKKLRVNGDGPPFIKIGREVRYIPRKVEHWIVERTKQSTKE